MPGGQLPISLLPDLPVGESIQNDDLFVLVHNGVTYKYPAGFLLALIGTGGGGTGNVKQIEIESNPLLVTDGSEEVWTIPNTLYDKYAQCVLYDIALNAKLTTIGNIVTDTEIKFKFLTGMNIPEGTYRASIQGVQKDAPIPPSGDMMLTEDGDTFITEEGDTFILDI